MPALLQHPIFQAITLPTWVTLSRLLAIPVVLVALAEHQQMVALIAFGLAALTDWLDGYLARKLNQISDLGKVLDPLVDKLVVLAPLLAFVEMGQVPAWGVFLVLTRELLVTAWRGAPTQLVPTEPVRLATSSTDSTAKTAPVQTIVGANLWGKAKTVTQMMAIALLILQLPYGLPLFWLSVILTLISGLLYVFV